MIYIYIYLQIYREMLHSDYRFLGAEIAGARKCFQHPLLTSKHLLLLHRVLYIK